MKFRRPSISQEPRAIQRLSCNVLGRCEDDGQRTQSGYRLYVREVLDRLDFIKRAQVLGFSLDEIKQIISEKQAGESVCEAVSVIVRTRLPTHINIHR